MCTLWRRVKQRIYYLLRCTWWLLSAAEQSRAGDDVKVTVETLKRHKQLAETITHSVTYLPLHPLTPTRGLRLSCKQRGILLTSCEVSCLPSRRCGETVVSDRATPDHQSSTRTQLAFGPDPSSCAQISGGGGCVIVGVCRIYQSPCTAAGCLAFFFRGNTIKEC